MKPWRLLPWLLLLTLLLSCSGGGATPEASRTFLMGATPFFTSANNGNVIYPDWRFENMAERDLLALHVDDFMGVPWDYCDASGCTNLPSAWVSRWQSLASQAVASGKTLYLAVSPLGGRRTLAPKVLADGSAQSDWNTALDGDGCYRFADDASATTYQAAYIGYLKYLIALVQPDYLSPGIEINMPFTECPSQKTAWMAWYNGVHTAIKASQPNLPVFATFQMEFMYGVVNTRSACASGSLSQCFDQRLAEALQINGDRLAFSTYPLSWKFSAEFNFAPPTDSYARARQATTRKLWVAETGWNTAQLRTSYAHDAFASCGSVLIPHTLDLSGVSLDVANEAAQASYLDWLLNQAQTQQMEAVVWWLNRDYLDGAVADSCPCDPADSSTCLLNEIFHTLGGSYSELLLRQFGNMALRRYDGSPRPAHDRWMTHFLKPHRAQ